MCEGAITPGFMIVTSMFYTRAEQTRRTGYWCTFLWLTRVFLHTDTFRSPDERICCHHHGFLEFWRTAHQIWETHALAMVSSLTRIPCARSDRTPSRLMLITGLLTLIVAVVYWYGLLVIIPYDTNLIRLQVLLPRFTNDGEFPYTGGTRSLHSAPQIQPSRCRKQTLEEGPVSINHCPVFTSINNPCALQIDSSKRSRIRKHGLWHFSPWSPTSPTLWVSPGPSIVVQTNQADCCMCSWRINDKSLSTSSVSLRFRLRCSVVWMVSSRVCSAPGILSV